MTTDCRLNGERIQNLQTRLERTDTIIDKLEETIMTLREGAALQNQALESIIEHNKKQDKMFKDNQKMIVELSDNLRHISDNQIRLSGDVQMLDYRVQTLEGRTKETEKELKETIKEKATQYAVPGGIAVILYEFIKLLIERGATL